MFYFSPLLSQQAIPGRCILYCILFFTGFLIVHLLAQLNMLYLVHVFHTEHINCMLLQNCLIPTMKAISTVVAIPKLLFYYNFIHRWKTIRNPYDLVCFFLLLHLSLLTCCVASILLSGIWRGLCVFIVL